MSSKTRDKGINRKDLNSIGLQVLKRTHNYFFKKCNQVNKTRKKVEVEGVKDLKVTRTSKSLT